MTVPNPPTFSPPPNALACRSRAWGRSARLSPNGWHKVIRRARPTNKRPALQSAKSAPTMPLSRIAASVNRAQRRDSISRRFAKCEIGIVRRGNGLPLLNLVVGNTTLTADTRHKRPKLQIGVGIARELIARNQIDPVGFVATA